MDNKTFNIRNFDNDIFYDSQVTHELNRYRYFMPISLNVEPVKDFSVGDEKDDFDVTDPTKIMTNTGGVFQGRHTLFNKANAVANNARYQVALNTPLFDTPTIREEIRKHSDCSVKALVGASERGEMGRAVYSYSDFMFCTHLGRISNNYLITLRRFPHPAGDHINYTVINGEHDSNEHMPAIGTMVTWLGTPGNDMASILKYDVNLPYKEIKAEIQEADGMADSNGGGLLGGLMNIGNPSYRAATTRGAAGESGIAFVSKILSPFSGGTNLLSPPNNTSWAYHRDMTKAYGPVDAIASTHIRAGAEDGGIKFEHNINLTFDYTLRAFDGINTRMAMLDLLANILSITYTNATYWKGAIRGNGAAQSNVFANLPIFKMQSPISMAGIYNSGMESLKQIGALFNNGNPIGSSGNILADLYNAGKNFLRGAFEVGMAGLLNSLGRPQKQGLNSLINFAPTGVWHLMIGNPRHPIMSMGNMILDNCSIEHYGPLGLDDFPTGLRVTISLKHGTPRDNLKIEQMYMNGDFRIYHALGNRGWEAWEQAEELYKGKDFEKSSHSVDKWSDLNIPQRMRDAAGKFKETIDDYKKRLESWKDSNGYNDITGSLADFYDKKTKFLTKYWGTDDGISILKTIKEADRGSEPRTTDTKKQENQSQGAKKRV